MVIFQYCTILSVSVILQKNYRYENVVSIIAADMLLSVSLFIQG